MTAWTQVSSQFLPAFPRAADFWSGASGFVAAKNSSIIKLVNLYFD
jgi:hypothetical protein